MLENGLFLSPADLARKLGISRSRVTQVLRLLDLTPEVLEAILDLGDPLSSPIITERRLRPIIHLSARSQKERVESIVLNKGSAI